MTGDITEFLVGTIYVPKDWLNSVTPKLIFLNWILIRHFCLNINFLKAFKLTTRYVDVLNIVLVRLCYIVGMK